MLASGGLGTVLGCRRRDLPVLAKETGGDIPHDLTHICVTCRTAVHSPLPFLGRVSLSGAGGTGFEHGLYPTPSAMSGSPSTPPPPSTCNDVSDGGGTSTCAGKSTGEDPKVQGSERRGSPTTTAGRSRKRLRKKIPIVMNTSLCKYEVVRAVCREHHIRDGGDGDDWHIFWTDTSVGVERAMEMKDYQKINHFPGMSEISRKDNLARNLNRLARQFPEAYNYYPKTWVFPADRGDFMNHYRKRPGKRTFICKPESGCQGKGIFLTKAARDLPQKGLVQEYVTKPLLIEGYKFDLRIYVLVTSCSPLHVYVYKEGLVRMATEKYKEPTSKNMENLFMHLTNYAINKKSNNYVRDKSASKGSKRSLAFFEQWLKDKGHDAASIWNDIDDTIIKTLITAHPIVSHNYKTCFPRHRPSSSACFEILGFDVMLDRKLRPWIIEVNHSPSFGCDTSLDRVIKHGVIGDAISILNIKSTDIRNSQIKEKNEIRKRLTRRTSKRQPSKGGARVAAAGQTSVQKPAESHQQKTNTRTYPPLPARGKYRCIYPVVDGKENRARYEAYFATSTSLFAETRSSKARKDCARQQIEAMVVSPSMKPGVTIPNRNGGRASTTASSLASESHSASDVPGADRQRRRLGGRAQATSASSMAARRRVREAAAIAVAAAAMRRGATGDVVGGVGSLFNTTGASQSHLDLILRPLPLVCDGF